MEAGQVLWETRRRQTCDMGILTTAGGLLFTGWMDRQFLAYDQETGKELWRTGVTGVPNASAITYSVDGKQYIAIVTGAGNPLSSGIPDVIPETQLPLGQQLVDLRVRVARSGELGARRPRNGQPRAPFRAGNRHRSRNSAPSPDRARRSA